MSGLDAKEAGLLRLRRKLVRARNRYSAERDRYVGLSDRKSASIGSHLEGRATGLGQAITLLDEERGKK